VVGGGIAGLATAALLAADGRPVTLLEKGGELGGRVGSYARDGFRFDTGASWYLMPEVFDHFFRMLGTSAAEQLDLVALDPSYRVFFEGHAEPLDLRPDPAANRALFESIEPGAGARLDAYLASAADTYEVAVRRFLYTNFGSVDSFTSLLHPAVLARSPRLARLLTRSLERFIASRFTDRRLRQILGYPAVFLGSSPSRAPSMYHLMSRMDLGDRVLYPQGGFTRLIEVVAAQAEKHGARLVTEAAVTAIDTTRTRRAAVRGVTYEDGEGVAHHLEADVVVGAVDLHHLETTLLPESLRSHPEPSWRRRSPGPGAVLVMLGVEGRLPQLSHHSLFFTADWRRNFEAIFGPHATVPDPASVYVCKPSETDPTVAPDGCENLFVLVPVPADVGLGAGGDDGAGDPAVERAADAAIDQVMSWAGIPDLRARIRVRRTVGPADFATAYHAWQGGALGLEHTLRQSAFLRPNNTSATVDGLYYAGASTVPGVGLPMCLISAELVLKHLRGDTSTGPSESPARDAAR
jgi:phytoene desaturase